MTSIAVAVSGGADSLYALSALKAQGYDVLALHGRFLPGDDVDPVPGLRDACAALDVSLHVLEMGEIFEANVVRPFAEAYAAGSTPNPCARCNARIKFGALLDAALALGAERLATGHYAGLMHHPVYGGVLRQGADAAKDQSYFLSLVPQERLRRAIFPLAEITKTAAVAALEKQRLNVPLPAESQEICFVPRDDYRAFLERRDREQQISLPGAGPMLLRDGRRIGRHQGLWRYTEGQRRGLGVAWSEPLYVIGKDLDDNALLLGTREDLGMRFCRTGPANLLVPPELWPDRLLARVRYRQRNMPATAEIRNGRLHICFEEPQMPCAPGQIAVVYDTDGVVLAGGIIDAPEKSGRSRVKQSTL